MSRMFLFLLYGWAISHSILAVLASGIASSSWRKPNATMSATDRVALAEAALQVLVSALPTFTEYPTVFYEMAAIDLATQQDKYNESLQQYLSFATQSQEKSSQPDVSTLTDWLSLGHAAATAHAAYRDPVFLGLANASWAFARSYTISAGDVGAGSMAGKDFSLPPTCQGETLLGGTFNTADPTDHDVTGFASGYFLILSASLAEATSDPAYLSAAQESLYFITTHLVAQNIVQDVISVGGNSSCALNDPTGPEIFSAGSFNAGLLIEGLAVLYSITNNASTLAIIDDVVNATLSNTDWVTPEGIVVHGGGKRGDMYTVRGLAEALRRNAITPELLPFVRSFLAVQFNALIDLATEGGNGSIYAGAWVGPPSAMFSPQNQTLAVSALLGGVALNQTDAPGSAQPPSPPSTGAGGPSGSPAAKTQPRLPRTAVIVGAVLGSLLVPATAGAVVWVIARRKARSGAAWMDRESTFVSTVSETDAASKAQTRTVARRGRLGLPALPPRQPEMSPYRMKVDTSPPARESLASTPLDPESASAVATRTETVAASPSSLPVDELPTRELLRMLSARLLDAPWNEGDSPPPDYSPRSSTIP
ncbi:hypothetical protein GGX14DRAFT_697598 [Mycena pura]|uniref:Glycoside hydrolase family 76 protein n=1 Tax=Mycena pura TaxID=153505 RepID=A0AAD6YAG1_9AGAR|nr:hypothetical protein GGX14DRAFT_697598 [Mycena pura]